MPGKVRVITLLGGLLLISPPGSTSGQTGPAQPAAVPEIVSALRAGHVPQAIELTRQALAAHPGNCQLLSLQGVAFSAEQQTDAALGAFTQTLRHCPSYLPALEGAAQIQFARKPPEAVPLLARIVALQAQNVPAQAMLATALAAKPDCVAAIPHFVAAQSAMPEHPDLRQAYGSCLAQVGDLPAALEQYRTLAGAHPGEASRYNVALLQWRQHKGDEALQTLQPLLAADTFEPAFSLAARIAESAGDTAHAVAWLRTAILIAPDRVDNYLAFADLAFDHGSFQVGVDVLNAGLQRMPAAAPLLVARGVLQMQLSRQTEAIADFEAAHKLDPQLSLSVDALGIVRTQQHQDQASLDLFRRQAKLHPEDPVVQYLLAEQLGENAYAGQADLQAAIEAAKQAASLDPQYQPAHDLLAKLYVRAQQPALAIAQAKLALALDPDDQEALYQELMAARRTGDAAAVKALVARLNQVRQETKRKEETADRYRLVDGVTP